MKFFVTVTTIQAPTSAITSLAERLGEFEGHLVVAGDSKGPEGFEISGPRTFLSLQDQLDGPYELARLLPTGHYCRKNIAYLEAIARGAQCIYETDDDNAPLPSWKLRTEHIQEARTFDAQDNASRWVNVYGHFSKDLIWPRGLPLDEIRGPLPSATAHGGASLWAPIQQGLANGSPDVDAIWRLVLDREFEFEDQSSVYLTRGNWCPFNTQSTWWWPAAFPLLYVPSYCTFRMCDIWKSFVAQRCIWELGAGVAFHAPEVAQDRNFHDLMRDFHDEIPGYELNRRIVEILENVDLKSGLEEVSENLKRCYESLVESDVFPEAELKLVDAWLADLHNTNR